MPRHDTDTVRPGIDLDAYGERIGYDGPRAATLDVLHALHALHPTAITFENLDPLLRRPVHLDAASLERKLVHERRGGYCFEQNLLLSHALRALGFRVRELAARVLWNTPAGKIMPRVHMLLQVEVEGAPFVADVGFGGLTLTAPLRLEPGREQPTPHEPFRLISDEDGFQLQARVRDGWKPIYQFDLQEQSLADYEVASWYHCTNTDSHFNSALVAARPVAGRRYALRNSEFVIHNLNGNSERRTLQTAAELCDVLTGPFGLTLPADPGLHAVLERFVAPAMIERRA
jgi:N-hydroxyarylamine O-acetyltransferase